MSKQEKMYRIVSGYDATVSDRATYCLKHGITLNIFCYWRSKWLSEQKQAKVEASPSFTLLSPTNKGNHHTNDVYELLYPNGVQLRLPSTLDISVLHQLIHLYV